jgi:hypothetical protein
MAEIPDVVERADALMRSGGGSLGGRRRRSFIAAPVDAADALDTPQRAIEEEDLPVLTDVVSTEPEAAPAPPLPARDDEALLSTIAADLVTRIEQQLAIELPMLIEAALINTQNELRAGISSIMGMALRDFLARRKQLQLPLDDPNHEN